MEYRWQSRIWDIKEISDSEETTTPEEFSNIEEEEQNNKLIDVVEGQFDNTINKISRKKYKKTPKKL